MKEKNTFLKVAAFGLCFAAVTTQTKAQTMYVVKNGTTVPISGIENVFFDGATSGDTL